MHFVYGHEPDALYRNNPEILDWMRQARALIQHCVDKGYGVKFWYIGNEGYAKGFSAETYAQTVDTYAAILRKVAPDITIIGDWKYGPQTETKNRFQETLKIVASSTELDLIEFHEKWAEDWGLVSGRTVADWLSEAPYLYRGRLTDCAHRVLDFARKIGKDKLRVGYNEWGFGDPDWMRTGNRSISTGWGFWVPIT
jgi:hypothetical protein